MKIKIGDRVRSYDFEGNDSCYMEGIVVDIAWYEKNPRLSSCERYKIDVKRQVWAGKVLTDHFSNDFVYPPVNGTQTLSGRFTCIVKRVEDCTDESAVGGDQSRV